MTCRRFAAILMFGLVIATQFISARQPTDPHEGRGSFLLQQIPLGLWYGSGLSQFLTTDETSERIQAGIGLLGTSACYFGPLFLVWNRPLSHGQAHLAVALGYRGIFAGLALSDLLKIGNETAYDPWEQYHYEYINPRPRAGMMVLTSLGSQVGGYFLARDLSLGQATLVSAYADFGWVNGLLGATVNHALTDGDPPVKVSAWYLGGLAAGTTAGYFRQKSRACTEGQVTFTRTAGFLGHAIPFSAVYALTGIPIEGENGHRQMTWLAPLMIAGNIGAVYSAERFIRDTPLSFGEGYITLGCAFAGGLLGSGIGWLLTDDNARWAMRPVIGGGTLGAVGGLALGVKLTAHQNGSNPEPPTGSNGRARIHINPAELTHAVADFVTRREFSAPQLLTIEF